MREFSVFNFLKNQCSDIYNDAIFMEKLIYLKHEKTAILAGQVVLSKINSQIDFSNIKNIKDLHREIFVKVKKFFVENYQDGVNIHISYEFDFSFFDDDLKISKFDLDDMLIQTNCNDESFLQSVIDEIQKIELIDYEGAVIKDKINYQIIKNEDNIFIGENKEEIILDDYQRDAVKYSGSKPLLIDAGPGAGKTRVIIERVLFLLNECNVSPSSILVITFTNKAAGELQKRFRDDTNLSYDVINQMKISTIHSFCRTLLINFEKKHYNLLKRNTEKGLFIQKHKSDLGFEREAFFYNHELHQISNKYDEYALFEVNTDALVNYIETAHPVSDEYKDYIDNFYQKHESWRLPQLKEIKRLNLKKDMDNARYLQIAKSWPLYIELMEREKVCDQNYLLQKAINILNNDDNLSNVVYKNILIDEFQDTDPLQMQIFDRLLKIADSFTIVGDVDQSIYSFRGGDPNFFTDFAAGELFETKILVNNYRSTSDIVGFNENFILNKRDTPKKLEAVRSSKVPVFLMENQDGDYEYRNIVRLISHLFDMKKISKYSDIALLFRSHNNKEDLLKELDAAGIEYYLKGIDDLIFQDEIKAVLTLFWYISPKELYTTYYYMHNERLNLYSFTDEYYNASKIFKLSHKTMETLKSLELGYQTEVTKKDQEYSKSIGENVVNTRLTQIFERQDEVLDKIYKDINKPDLTRFTRQDFIEIGIDDEHDLDFFLRLNELKALIENKKIKNREKPSTLEIYYKLLEITGYLEDIFSRGDAAARKAKLNLGLLSEIISDYENIMGKHQLKTLFEYLTRVLKHYSCPVNDFEDNSNKVHIMTVHKAKGLEYPIIFTSSLKDNSFPLSFNLQSVIGPYDRNNRPVYYTPRIFLKHKVKFLKMDEAELEEIMFDCMGEEFKKINKHLLNIEAENFEKEEERVVYVSNTRAEDALILSTQLNRNKKIPSILIEHEKKYGEINRIESFEYNKIKKVNSHKSSENEMKFNQINMEDILNDYLFCPVKYNVVNNLKYRNPKMMSQFIKERLNNVLTQIHKNSEVENSVSQVISAYHLPSKDVQKEVEEKFEKLSDYWQEYGKNYDIYAYDYSVTCKMTDGDLNGNIDLIISEDESVSIVQFVLSIDKIENYLDYYIENLHFYGYCLSNEGYNVNNLILNVIDDNKQYVIKYNEKQAKITMKLLDNVVSDILNDNFTKHKIHCIDCEFYGITCNHREIN